MAQDTAAHLLGLNERLLDSIAARDFATYTSLCDERMTAFEPEAVGHLVEGLGFPRPGLPQPVRMLGQDAAVVSFVRLQQKIDSATGRPLTLATEETRVWAKQADGVWRNVHFHRSPASS